MSPLMMLLTPQAGAYSIPCAARWVAPSEGQTDVPTDVRLLALRCDTEVSIGIGRPGERPVAVAVDLVGGELVTGWPAELDPNTEYEIVATDDTGVFAQLRFTTGDGPAQPAVDAPEFEVLYSAVSHRGVWGRRSGGADTFVDLSIPPPEVGPDNLVVAVVEGPGETDVDAWPWVGRDPEFQVHGYGPSPAAGEELCVTVTVQDAAGAPSPASTQCFAPDDELWRPTPFQPGGCGCDGGGVGAIGGGVTSLLGAALLVIRGRPRAALQRLTGSRAGR